MGDGDGDGSGCGWMGGGSNSDAKKGSIIRVSFIQSVENILLTVIFLFICIRRRRVAEKSDLSPLEDVPSVTQTSHVSPCHGQSGH